MTSLALTSPRVWREENLKTDDLKTDDLKTDGTVDPLMRLWTQCVAVTTIGRSEPMRLRTRCLFGASGRQTQSVSGTRPEGHLLIITLASFVW
jgi:hypothetical protein